MLCRTCGIEIADKALICYRCGTATTEPKFKPAAAPRPSAVLLVASALALALLAGLALYMGGTPSGDTPRYAAWAAAVALVVVVLWAVARRRVNR